MNKPRKHAELIKAWADGAEIQMKTVTGEWTDAIPSWNSSSNYRIKPQPRVIWVNEYGGRGGDMCYENKDEALSGAGTSAARIAVRYVEQPEEGE